MSQRSARASTRWPRTRSGSNSSGSNQRRHHAQPLRRHAVIGHAADRPRTRRPRSRAVAASIDLQVAAGRPRSRACVVVRRDNAEAPARRAASFRSTLAAGGAWACIRSTLMLARDPRCRRPALRHRAKRARRVRAAAADGWPRRAPARARSGPPAEATRARQPAARRCAGDDRACCARLAALEVAAGTAAPPALARHGASSAEPARTLRRLRSRRRSGRTCGHGTDSAMAADRIALAQCRVIMQIDVRIISTVGVRPAGLREHGRAVADGAVPDGFRSDMTGAKALHLERHCAQRGRASCASTIAATAPRAGGSRTAASATGATTPWRSSTRSSTGRWCWSAPAWAAGSCCWRRWRGRSGCAGLVGIAAAPDFTHDLIAASLTAEHRAPARARRRAPGALPTTASRYPITRRLLEDGERHLLLAGAIPLRCPVHLLHGQLDPDVPWQTSLRLAARLESAAVTVELIKDGDHRLSREEDLRRIAAALDRVLEQAAVMAERPARLGCPALLGRGAGPGHCRRRRSGFLPRAELPVPAPAPMPLRPSGPARQPVVEAERWSPTTASPPTRPGPAISTAWSSAAWCGCSWCRTAPTTIWTGRAQRRHGRVCPRVRAPAQPPVPDRRRARSGGVRAGGARRAAAGLRRRQGRHRGGEPDHHAGAPEARRFLAADSLTDVREIVVTGPDSPPLASLEDLAGMEILARRSSSYWPSLEALNGRLRAKRPDRLRLQPVPEAVEDEDLLELVAPAGCPWRWSTTTRHGLAERAAVSAA